MALNSLGGAGKRQALPLPAFPNGRVCHEQFSRSDELAIHGSPISHDSCTHHHYRSACRWATRRAPPPETAATLPEGNAVAEVLVELNELFGDSGEASVVTLLFGGESLTPDGLSQMDSLINDMVSDPKVRDLLAPANPVVAPSLLVKAILQVEDLQTVTQADIESTRSFPDLQRAFDALTGTDTDGTPVAIATIRLHDTGDE